MLPGCGLLKLLPPLQSHLTFLPGSEAGRSHGWIPRIPGSGRLGQGQVLDKQIKGEPSWARRAGWHIMRWVSE